MPSDKGESISERARNAFAEFLVQRELGGGVDFEAFCAARPELEAELRELWVDWKRIVDVLEQVPPDVRASTISDKGGEGDVDAGIAEDVEPAKGESSASNLIRRLAIHRPRETRYELRDEIAHGGMGAILRVWDEDLRRDLAMKVMLAKGERARRGKRPSRRDLARFLEEAQITGQLDHPGVVPVHELGLDSKGRVYYTMPLIKGHDLLRVFDMVREEKKGWNLPRAIGVMIKVCEAVAFAHSKGVIHRDLKPGNIMVGRFGQVYVMDWGVARVMGRDDVHDLRLRQLPSAPDSEIRTERQDQAAETPESALVTRDGEVLGTPSYMPPEQAQGRIDEVGPLSDVYSIGAMLYHLLSGQMPYVRRGQRVPGGVIHERVKRGPPAPLEEICPDAPEELVAICNRAMARDPEDRYSTAMRIAADLEAYLGRRPISVVDSSLGYLLKLAVQRNRAVTATIAVALVIVLTIVTFFIQSLQDAVDETTTAYDVLSAEALVGESTKLYPLVPQNVGRIESWLERAGELTARSEVYQEQLEDAQARGHEEEAARLSGMLGHMATLRELLPRVTEQAEVARHLQRDTIEEYTEKWDEVIEDLASHEAFRRHPLSSQLGLVPLQKNPQSGLWEFWHVLSGDEPFVDTESGNIELEEESGIVLVLLPGGVVQVGSPDVEPGRAPNELRHEVALVPFFLAKYEVTQSQWIRVMQDNPSGTRAGKPARGVMVTGLHPVEHVNWFESEEFVRRMDLELPTERQWEYACRGGEAAAFHWGVDQAEAGDFENIRDLTFQRNTGLPTDATWEDRYCFHAPVGSFLPNAYGLFDMQGNVSEWCLDWDQQQYPVEPGTPGDGLLPGKESRIRKAHRGASWYLEPGYARSAFRQHDFPRSSNHNRGLRVARAVRK